ncbi:nucleoside phosphorylase [Silvibacterium sp.]|uniref:phosphorylase family protein n=1 Tax=Silvibacterium sp. TaxID=1964179 RepID=UPI0039E65E5F
MSTRIAIVAAIPGELTPLVKGWKQTGKYSWSGKLGEHECVAVAGGMGAAAANRAVNAVRGSFEPEVLVSYGWAGALTCGLKPGMASGITEVVHLASGKRYESQNAEGTRLLTLNYVARAADKRKLAEQNRAVLVDMEAAAVARLAKEYRLGFYCFKGVSDGYLDDLPDFGRFISNQGQLRMLPFLQFVGMRPWYWRSLAKLGTNSRKAAAELADLTRESLRQSL